MAITYPLSTDSFIALLRVQVIYPYLQFQQELAPQASGGVVAKDLGPALWMADIQTATLKNDLFEEIQAAIESLQGSIGTFYLYDTKRWYPKADFGGTILGASAVTINAVPDAVSLSLKGLPPGYVLSPGDRFHFDYGSARAFHRVLETVTADGAGVTPAFAVSPHIRPGAVANQAVTLIKPTALMRIVPGTHAVMLGLISTIQFRAQQVILEMRDMDPAVVTALAQKQFKRRTFFSITARNFSTGAPAAAYFWNDLGLITCDVIDGLTGGTVARTFTGSGTLIQCAPIPLTSDLSPRNITVTLNQVDSRIDDYVRGYDLKNAYCEIHRGLYNPVTHAIVDKPFPIFVGFADSAPIQSPAAGNPGSIPLNLVSHTRELTRAGYAVRSHEDQIARVPGDEMLKYTGVMATVQLFWGQQKISATGNAGGAASTPNPVMARFG